MARSLSIPKNEPVKPDKSPRVFMFYGGTMTGKSYAIHNFPDPIVLNTDKNAEKLGFPSIDISPIREQVTKTVKMNKVNKRTGRQEVVNEQVTRHDIVKPVHSIVDEVLSNLKVYQETSKKPYKTLVVDVIDDVATSEEEYVLQYYNDNIKSDKTGEYGYIGDIPHAGGWGRFNNFFETLVRRVREFDSNIEYVIFISREKNVGTDDEPQYDPGIRKSLVNIINGFGDYMIHFNKLGNKYVKTSMYKRTDYKTTDIKDESVRKFLMETRNALEDVDRRGNIIKENKK